MIISACCGRRADCRAIGLVLGDSCRLLAFKCQIPGADITKYNTQANFCMTLVPYQYICCSSGNLSDIISKPNPNGSCAMYQSVVNDNCYSIIAVNGIIVASLERFNKVI